MLRKSLSLLLVMSLFFTLVLNAAAAPITAAPGAVSNMFTEGNGAAAEIAPEAVPAMAGAFLLGVAAGVVSNAVYDYAKHRAWVWSTEEQAALDGRADLAFDY